MIRPVKRLLTGTLEDCNCSKINLKGVGTVAARKRKKSRKKKTANRNQRWCVYKGKRKVSCHRLKRAATKAAKSKKGTVRKGPGLKK